MEWYHILALMGVGLVAGFINTLAGGGSLLTLPMLIFLGLSPHVANGTNRIAILLQNISGSASFYKQKVLEPKKDFHLIIPAIIGAIIGASLSLEINEDVFKVIIGVVLIVMFFFVLFNPNKWVKSQVGNVSGKRKVIQYLVFFFIGVYGGLIQAGVGFFLIAGLILSVGCDLVKANAVKLFIVLFYTLFALAIFIINKQIDYAAGLIMASGNMAGAWIGAKVGVKYGAGFVRYILMLALVAAALGLFGVF